MVYVGVNFRMSETELRSVFDTAEPRLLITEPEFEHLAPRQGVPALVLDCAGPSDSHEAALAAASEVLPDCAYTVFPSGPFAIVYTSGTTGLPRGILFDHAAALQHGTVACLEYEITPQARFI